MHYPAYEAGDRAPVRARLATYLRQEAEWRDEKAVEYPDDPRNERSAQALRALADHVDGLPRIPERSVWTAEPPCDGFRDRRMFLALKHAESVRRRAAL